MMLITEHNIYLMHGLKLAITILEIKKYIKKNKQVDEQRNCRNSFKTRTPFTALHMLIKLDFLKVVPKRIEEKKLCLTNIYCLTITRNLSTRIKMCSSG